MNMKKKPNKQTNKQMKEQQTKQNRGRASATSRNVGNGINNYLAGELMKYCMCSPGNILFFHESTLPLRAIESS